MASYSDSGCLVDLNVIRGGAKIARSFQPDFVLIRSPVRTESFDWRKIVIGLLYGGVPSLNSLHSIYNFLDKPWVFAHLLMIQRRVGREKFPLIDQVYYPTISEMTYTPKFPLVVKIGRGVKGAGKIRVNDATELSDVSSVVAVTNEDSTVEPYIDSKYDIHIQKIGTCYKAFMRKGISGHWKANLGSAMLEQIAMTDRYKLWVDEVSQLFGGLDICSVEAIVGKDSKEVIYEANDCSLSLMGETQEDDRRLIAELALQKMNHILGVRQALNRKESLGSAAPQNFIKHETPSYFQNQPAAAQQGQPPMPQGAPPALPNRPPAGTPPTQPLQGQRMRSGSGSAGPPPTQGTPAQPTGARPQPTGGPPGQQSPAQKQPMPQGSQDPPSQGPPPAQPPAAGGAPRGPPPPRPTRQPSLPKQPSKDSATTNSFCPPSQGPPQQVPSGQPPPAQPPQQQQHSGEDTMTNLRKTFAGIFGDM